MALVNALLGARTIRVHQLVSPNAKAHQEQQALVGRVTIQKRSWSLQKAVNLRAHATLSTLAPSQQQPTAGRRVGVRWVLGVFGLLQVVLPLRHVLQKLETHAWL